MNWKSNKQLWNTFHDPEYVEKAFQRSFDNLNLGYIDLYLIHYPISYRRVIENSRLPPDDVNAFYVFPFEDGSSIRCLTSQILYHVFSATRLFCNYSFYPLFECNSCCIVHYEWGLLKIVGKTARADIDYLDTWRAMEKLVQSGRVRSIGLSNFNSEQTDRVLFFAKIKPVTNQVSMRIIKSNLKSMKLIANSRLNVIPIWINVNWLGIGIILMFNIRSNIYNGFY